MLHMLFVFSFLVHVMLHFFFVMLYFLLVSVFSLLGHFLLIVADGLVVLPYFFCILLNGSILLSSRSRSCGRSNGRCRRRLSCRCLVVVLCERSGAANCGYKS